VLLLLLFELALQGLLCLRGHRLLPRLRIRGARELPLGLLALLLELPAGLIHPVGLLPRRPLRTPQARQLVLQRPGVVFQLPAPSLSLVGSFLLAHFRRREVPRGLRVSIFRVLELVPQPFAVLLRAAQLLLLLVELSSHGRLGKLCLLETFAQAGGLLLRGLQLPTGLVCSLGGSLGCCLKIAPQGIQALMQLLALALLLLKLRAELQTLRLLPLGLQPLLRGRQLLRRTPGLPLGFAHGLPGVRELLLEVAVLGPLPREVPPHVSGGRAQSVDLRLHPRRVTGTVGFRSLLLPHLRQLCLQALAIPEHLLVPTVGLRDFLGSLISGLLGGFQPGLELADLSLELLTLLAEPLLRLCRRLRRGFRRCSSELLGRGPAAASHRNSNGGGLPSIR